MQGSGAQRRERRRGLRRRSHPGQQGTDGVWRRTGYSERYASSPTMPDSRAATSGSAKALVHAESACEYHAALMCLVTVLQTCWTLYAAQKGLRLDAPSYTSPSDRLPCHSSLFGAASGVSRSLPSFRETSLGRRTSEGSTENRCLRTTWRASRSCCGRATTATARELGTRPAWWPRRRL